MHILLVFLVATIVSIGAEISPSRILADAEEFTKLQKTYLSIPSYGPPRVVEKKLRCRVVKQCCPERRNELFSLVPDRLFEEKCINKRKHSPSCTRATNAYADFENNSQVLAIRNYYLRDTRRSESVVRKHNLMQNVCSKKELESYYCHPEDLSKYQSCQYKVLEELTSNNSDNYYIRTVRLWKEDIKRDNEKLQSVFASRRM